MHVVSSERTRLLRDVTELQLLLLKKVFNVVNKMNCRELFGFGD